MHKELKIIYKNNKPYGIRDDTGFLFFFAKVSKFSGQEERYREEVEEQYRLADFLLFYLQGRTAEQGEAETQPITGDKSEPAEICPACSGNGEVTGPGAGGMELITCNRCNSSGNIS